jgi:hypothetical protein
MTRETRLVAILCVIGAAGVGGLAIVADQYRKALARDSATVGSEVEDRNARAGRLVGGFLAARERASVTIDRADAGAMGEYRSVRKSALAAYGMTEEDYAAVRNAWRAWSKGERLADPALAAAFAARRVALERTALGPSESMDDGIK